MAINTPLEMPDLSEFVTEIKLGIVDTEWNPEIIRSMKVSARNTLTEAGLSEDQWTELTVPGAFELPMGAKILLENGKYDAIICLGCVIKGETSHDQHINRSVSSALMQLGLMSDIPIIFGVLTPNTEEQARERAGGSKGDKGREAAITALKMISLKFSFKKHKKKIGY